jgi:acyl dehydratase
MTINPAGLLSHRFTDIAQSYTQRDAILYALGIGLGHDPCNRNDLRYLLETDLQVLPSYAVTLASPGMWIGGPEFGVDFAKLVHSEQMAWFHGPLPPAASIIGRARVLSLSDRGAERGALLVLERSIHDATDGRLYSILHQTLLLRGDGGFGGPPPKPAPNTIPDREADHRTTAHVSTRAALIYRLSGDWNPLHVEPDAARRAGFERPILHGLASYGMSAVSVARACGRSPERIAQLGCRFSGVVFPGDLIEFLIWHDDDKAFFQAFVGDRKVLDQGLVSFGDV